MPRSTSAFLKYYKGQPGRLVSQLRSLAYKQSPAFRCNIIYLGISVEEQRVNVDDQSCFVLSNCCYALWQAAIHYPGEYVWIDYICINQNNPDEKSFQVGIMGDIYKKARRALACVGPHDDNSESLFELGPTELEAATMTMVPQQCEVHECDEWMLSKGEAELLRFLHAYHNFEARRSCHGSSRRSLWQLS